MQDFIQDLLNGYEVPVFLSDAYQGTILFTNKAVEQKLGLSQEYLQSMRIDDLLEYDRVIRNQAVIEHNNDHYLVQNEELTISGTAYIKSVLKPYEKEYVLSHLDFQKEMTSRLIHRLRSPINGVSGFCELLNNSTLKEKQRRYVRSIEEGMNDIASVLAQVQVLAEPVTVNESEVESYILAEQVLDDLPERYRGHVSLAIDQDVETLRTDVTLLKAIIEECLLNAIEHGDEPAITLHFKKDRIRINNDGPVIEKSLASKIFYPFFSSKARNVGVGLAKCTLYAHHLGVELKLAQNSSQNGVSFDIVF